MVEIICNYSICYSGVLLGVTNPKVSKIISTFKYVHTQPFHLNFTLHKHYSHQIHIIAFFYSDEN